DPSYCDPSYCDPSYCDPFPNVLRPFRYGSSQTPPFCWKVLRPAGTRWGVTEVAYRLSANN
ncbi:hypothetical protein, partial [Enterococcus gallinarum]|uniref:hypothetical protein n=1 Tax=Enterococcus gallinarum TaxID=1353 RepID=UPI001962F7EC